MIIEYIIFVRISAHTKDKIMKKHLAIVLVATLVILSSLFVACNAQRGGSDIVLQEGSTPQLESLFDEQTQNLINDAISSTDESVKKDAVVALYSVANNSRINSSLGLMIQKSVSDGGMYTMIMNGFTLNLDSSWYYQLVTDVETGNETLDLVFGAVAGQVQVGYTTDKNVFNYVRISGNGGEQDCSVETFPYASFNLTKELVQYDEAGFEDERNTLEDQLELVNLDLFKEVVADGSIIEDKGDYYEMSFAINTSADEEDIARWSAMGQEDMKGAGDTAYRVYNKWEAVLQVWKNGYAKSFVIAEDYTGYNLPLINEGQTVSTHEFVYLWNESEILSVLSESQSDKFSDAQKLTATVQNYFEAFTNQEIVKANLNIFEIVGIVAGCLVAIIIAIIVTVELLVKGGKLPKLAKKREEKKQKRLEKKAAKSSKADEDVQEENLNSDAPPIDVVFEEMIDPFESTTIDDEQN